MKETQDLQPLSVYRIRFLTVHDLRQEGTLQQIYDLIEIIKLNDDSITAAQLRRQLKSILGKKENLHLLSSQQQEDCIAVIKQLDFFVLPELRDDEIVEIFSKNVVFAIKSDIDLVEQVKNFHQVYLDPKISFDFSNLASRGLGMNNVEHIGTQKIMVPGDLEPVEPTVANWLRSYSQFFSPSQARGPLEESEYLTKNDEVKKLDNKDRKLLEKLIRLYDFLKFPNQFITPKPTPNLREQFRSSATETPREEVREESLSEHIQVEQEKAQTAEPKVGNPILQAYQGDPKRQEEIAKTVDKLRKKYGTDTAKLRRAFYKAVQGKDEITVIALFRLLAELNDLGKFLAEDKRLHEFMRGVWQKEYGEALVKDFEAQPNQPKYVTLFLQYILMERLGLPEHDAARVGVNVSNIYKKNQIAGYERIAYFDAKTNKFKFFES